MSDSVAFEALADLRTSLTTLREHHFPTMNHYASTDGKGFWHQATKKDTASLSSSATCVSSLVHAGIWNQPDHSWGTTSAVAERLITKPWRSAGLEENNPFSVSFIGQGVLDLAETGDYEGKTGHLALVHGEIAKLLFDSIDDDSSPLAVSGAVSIAPYPPSAYLTELAFRVLKRADDNALDIALISKKVRRWARGEAYRQISLIKTGNRLADPLQLAYAVILLADSAMDEQNSPEEKALIQEALETFFGSQLPDGTWPPSQPIFHYPDVGNAQCYEYELLTELLRCKPLQDELLGFMKNFQAAVRHLNESYFDLGPAQRGWASGHHPQIEGPESWSTACVYDFVYALDRLVAEAIRRALFSEVREVYTRPGQSAASGTRVFAPSPKAGPPPTPGFLDATVTVDGNVHSLRATLFDYFVKPIDEAKGRVEIGFSLGRKTPMSAILFGPPGTSKTELAKLIGKYIDWPVLLVDPSYVVQDGLDRLYARANRLFSMLAAVEEVVVLLDEFDELGRDRAQETEVLSRFITTAMLPKLAAINKARKIVFLLATNYLTRFDAAFRRGGRFDMVIQVMPPTTEAKLNFPEWKPTFDVALARLKGVRKKRQAETWIADLTFLETEELVSKLNGSPDVYADIKAAHEAGTLMRKNGRKTWKQTSADEADLIRLPPLPRS